MPSHWTERCLRGLWILCYFIVHGVQNKTHIYHILKILTFGMYRPALLDRCVITADLCLTVLLLLLYVLPTLKSEGYLRKCQIHVIVKHILSEISAG